MMTTANEELTAKIVLDCKNALGEGIQWNAHDQRLYWTDIFGDALWSCDANGSNAVRTSLPGKLCAFAFQPDQKMIAGFADGLYEFDPATGARKLLQAYQPTHPETRLNDGNLDRQGRFIIGGMNENGMAKTIPVWSWNGSTLTTLADQVGCANSICFSPDGQTMYFADSADTAIYAFDYDVTTGSLGKKRLFSDVKHVGIPDGSTIDSEGGLWNARFQGGCVLRFDKDGNLDFIVRVPVPNVTCCCFGGANLDRLFITTARLAMEPKDLEATPLAGGLFAVDIPFRGLPHGQFISEERTSR